jgi:ubiquitin-activating enzyme E1
LFAYNFNIAIEIDLNVVRNMAAECAATVPEWNPSNAAKIVIDDGEAEAPAGEDDKDADLDLQEVQALRAYFDAENFDELKELTPAEFEKDDDTNFHIDFIAAASNLRAWNYRIFPLSTRHHVKMTAGKIIPALATTTAMISGLVELELYKLVLGLPADSFAKANVNLAVNQFQSFSPLPPKKAKAEFDPVMYSEIVPIPVGFTVWDKVTVRVGDLTVQQFCEALTAAHHGVRVNLLFKEGISQKDIDEEKAQALYNSNAHLPKLIKDKQKLNFERNLRELYCEVYGEIAASQNYVVLTGDFVDKDRNSCVIPRIAYYFR